MESMNQNITENDYNDFNKKPDSNVYSTETTIPSEYKPLSPWAYVGYNLLFFVPVLGWIFLVFFAFSNKNINRRNYARSFFCIFLLVVPIYIVIIILAAMVMNTSTDVIDNFVTSTCQVFTGYTEEQENGMIL